MATDEMTHEKPTSGRLEAAALAFAMLFPTLMTWGYFVAIKPDDGPASPFRLFAYGIGKTIQFGFPLAYVAWTAAIPIRMAEAFRAGWSFGIGFALLTAASMAWVYFVWLKHSPWLGDTPNLVRDKVAEFGISSFGKFVAFALFLSAVHSMLEEYYWRWFVFGQLRRRLPAAAAIGLSSVGFMLHHIVLLVVYFPERTWTLAIPFSLGVAVGGAVWAWLYDRSDSLLPSWASHALIDAAIMVIGWDLVTMAGG